MVYLGGVGTADPGSEVLGTQQNSEPQVQQNITEQECKQQTNQYGLNLIWLCPPTGMHKKSLEMSKKCSSPPVSDSTRSDTFCSAPERRCGGEAREADEEELLEEEDEEMEEEVAIDLSSSSKQQQQQQEEGGGSTRTAPSPQRQSGGESDSWRSEESDVGVLKRQRTGFRRSAAQPLHHLLLCKVSALKCTKLPENCVRSICLFIIYF